MGHASLGGTAHGLDVYRMAISGTLDEHEIRWITLRLNWLQNIPRNMQPANCTTEGTAYHPNGTLEVLEGP